MKLSVSSLKKYCSSRQERAGKYLLGLVNEPFPEENYAIGDVFEHWLFTGIEDYSLLQGRKIEDYNKVIEAMNNLMYNGKGFPPLFGVDKVKVEGIVFGELFMGYLDRYSDQNEGTIVEIKTSQYLTDPNNTNKNMWSGLTTYEEYELQCYCYMKMKGCSKAELYEYGKHKYKDGRLSRQIIKFELTPEFEKKMEDKYVPYVRGMVELKNKFYSKLEENGITTDGFKFG